jgi:hypothetical protein
MVWATFWAIFSQAHLVTLSAGCMQFVKVQRRKVFGDDPGLPDFLDNMYTKTGKRYQTTSTFAKTTII